MNRAARLSSPIIIGRDGVGGVMAADKNEAFNAPDRESTRTWGLLWTVAVLVMVGVALSPLILGLAYGRAGVDYGAVGDVGQAYGAASALVATTALVAT